MKNKDFFELMGTVYGGDPTDPVGHRARVRESMDRNPDLTGFSDYELLEYMLFMVIPRKDTKAIAKNLIQTFGSFSSVLHADFYELVRVEGIGERTAHFLANVLPIVLRAEYLRFEKTETLDTPSKTARYLYSRFLGLTKEKLLLTTLNINDEVIHTSEISYGSVDTAYVDLMKILRFADRDGAKKIILAHNHPGGTMEFSDSDIETTARIVTCCMLTGLTFYDHLIFYGNKYLSMYGNDVLAKAFAACEKVCDKLSLQLAKENTRRSVLAKLRECNMGGDSYEYKKSVLGMYASILEFDKEDKESIVASLLQDIEKVG